MAVDGSSEDLKNSGVMVNADGDFVVANPDKAAWEVYQEKMKASAAAAAEAAAAEGSKELRARGLECPIDKRMFLEPTKTPCCQQTYCNECITNALIESDFVCPGCSTEGVLLDNLTADDEAVSKIKTYEAEKAEEKKEKEKQEQVEKSNETQEKDDETPKETPHPTTTASPSAVQDKPETSKGKKRPAEEEPESEEPPESSLAAKKPKPDDQQSDTDAPQNAPQDNAANMMPFPFNQQMPFPNPAFSQPHGMPSMPFPDNSFMANGMGMMNPMMAMNFQQQGNNSWNPMGGGNFGFPGNGMFGDGSMFPGNNFDQVNSFNPMQGGQSNNFMQAQSGYPYGGVGMNGFPNPQRASFNTPASNDDNAYFRQPVNPHRHQARQRRIRPSDYREL
jgi:protein MPE1